MTNSSIVPLVSHTYKDSLFRLVFRDKENLLSLYNAMNKTDYHNPDDLQIVTLENAIYIHMKNDVAFLIYDELHLYEHQSTYNPNMPLRFLFYIAHEYEALIQKKTLYSSAPIKLPTPYFVVLYNGTAAQPEYKMLHLSELFAKPEVTPALELSVEMFNINYGHNKTLLERCKILSDYSKFVDRIRKYDTMDTEEAVDRAVTECISEGILDELLTTYRREVVQMSIFEFDEEREMKLIREAERDAGYEQGKNEGIREGENRGRLEGKILSLYELTQEGILSIEAAAQKLGMTPEDFNAKISELLKK